MSNNEQNTTTSASSVPESKAQGPENPKDEKTAAPEAASAAQPETAPSADKDSKKPQEAAAAAAAPQEAEEAEKTGKKKKKKVGKGVFITTGIVAALVLAYTGGGFWGVPEGINWALKKYADPMIDRKVTTEKIEFNPYTLHLKIQGLNVAKDGEKDPLLHVNELDTKVSWKSLIKLSPIVDHVTVDGLNANIERTGLAKFNFSDIINRVENMMEQSADKDKEEKKDDKPLQFAIQNVQLLNSNIKLDDKYRDRKDAITDLNFAVPLISNFDTEVDNPITPKLTFNLNGKPFNADANSIPFAISKKTGANFSFKEVPVENVVSFIPFKLNAKVLSGDLSANLNLAFAEQDPKLHEIKHLRLKGNVTIDNLAIEDDLGHPQKVASIGQVSVDIGSVSLFAQRMLIDNIAIKDPKVLLIRDGDKINLAELGANIIAEEPKAEKAEPAKEPAPAKVQAEKKEDVQAPAAEEKKAEEVKKPEAQAEAPAPEAAKEAPKVEEKPAGAKPEGETKVSSIADFLIDSAFAQSTHASQSKAKAAVHKKETAHVKKEAKTKEEKLREERAAREEKLKEERAAKAEKIKEEKAEAAKAKEEKAEAVKAKEEQAQQKAPGEAAKQETAKPEPAKAEQAKPEAAKAEAPKTEQAKPETASAGTVPASNAQAPASSGSSLAPAAIGAAVGAAASAAGAKDGAAEKAPAEPAKEAAPAPAQAAAEAEEIPVDASPVWHWDLKNVQVTGGEVTFQDKTAGFETKVEGVTATLAGLTNRVNVPADLKVKFNALKGESDIAGKVQLFPLNVDLNIQENKLDLTAVQPYLTPFTSAIIKSAELNNKLHLTVTQKDKLVETALKGEVKVQNIGVGMDKAEVVKIGSIDTQGLNLLIGKNIDAEIGKVLISNPSAQVALLKDGQVNLAQLAVPGKAQKAAKAPEKAVKEEKKAEPKEEKKGAAAGHKNAEAAPAVSWAVKEIAVENGTVDFKDESNGFAQKITGLNVSFAGLNSKNMNGNKLNASLHALGGSVNANGTVNLAPVGVDMNVKTSALNLTQLKPYYQSLTPAQIGSANLSTDGTVAFAMKGDSPDVAYKGSVSLAKLKVADKKGAEVAAWNDLAVKGIDFKLANSISANIGSILLEAPHFNIVKPAKGPMNILALAGEESAPAAKAAPAKGAHKAPAKASSAKSEPMPPISIAKIDVKNGSVSFIDEATKPDFRVKVADLNADVTNFSTSGAKPLNVKLNAQINGAPLNVTGNLNPFAKQLAMDLKAKFNSFSMPVLSPYAADVTGYPIQQGQLTLDGTYSIKNEELNAANKITINKLEFGNEVPNAKSTLPVGLAVSLLQNSDGVIDLNLPITGKLNDPEFSVAGIIVKVIGNLITKAVTAPFSLIGSIFGASSDMNLENIPFASGSPALDQNNTKELDVIAKAMNDRPGIKLKVYGLASPKDDADGLLMRQIQQKVYDDAKGEKKLTDDQITNGINKLFRSFDGQKPDTDDVAKKKAFLLQHLQSQDLINLANGRAQSVVNYLTKNQKIAADRLFIQNPIGNDLGDLRPGVKIELQN